MSDYEPVFPAVIDGVALRKKLSELFTSKRISTDAWNVVVGKLESCKLDIQPPAKIEAAIRKLEKQPVCVAWNGYEVADLLRWVLGQPQDTWKPEDFGLIPTEEGLVPNEREVLDKETPKQKAR